ncbi:MAG: hypothetical protein WDA75_10070 [Candidatus Latescibacterota bacterium]
MAIGYCVEDPEGWKRHRTWLLGWATAMEKVRLPGYARSCQQATVDDGALAQLVTALEAEAGCTSGPVPRPSQVLRQLGGRAVGPLQQLITRPGVLPAARVLTR